MKNKLGKMIYEPGFFRDTWLVLYQTNKNSSSYAIFHNFERARIFSKLVEIQEAIK